MLKGTVLKIVSNYFNETIMCALKRDRKNAVSRSLLFFKPHSGSSAVFLKDCESLNSSAVSGLSHKQVTQSFLMAH